MNVKTDKRWKLQKKQLGQKAMKLQQSGCGNGMCEPNVGETEANCSQDCTGED